MKEVENVNDILEISKEDLDKLIDDRVSEIIGKKTDEAVKQAFTANDLDGLRAKVLNKQIDSTDDRINIVEHSSIVNGLPSTQWVAKITTTGRSGIEIVQPVSVNLVLTKPQFAEELGVFFKEQYEKQSVKLPFSPKVNDMLVSRGILHTNFLNHVKRTTLEVLITSRYFVQDYISVWNEVKNFIKEV